VGLAGFIAIKQLVGFKCTTTDTTLATCLPLTIKLTALTCFHGPWVSCYYLSHLLNDDYNFYGFYNLNQCKKHLFV